jgi:hypothetical protein
LLKRVFDSARRHRVIPVGPLTTDYVNTIPREDEQPFPGDEQMEKRIRRIVRWNAVAMVHRANVRYPGIGGHLSTDASSARLYEVGFNHFSAAGTTSTRWVITSTIRGTPLPACTRAPSSRVASRSKRWSASGARSSEARASPATRTRA